MMNKGNLLIVDDEKVLLDKTAILLEDIADKIFTAETGADALEIFSQNKILSISHSGNYAAVIISDQSVGIDIEKINGKAYKIKHKFLHIELNYPQELNNQTSLVYWNIKESIYKAVGITGIDFKKNILALPLDINSSKCISWYVNNDDIYSFETHFRISKNYNLAFVIKN